MPLRKFAIILLCGIGLIGATVGLRAPWLDVSIWNLDEGSTMTMGQQMLVGDVLYRDAVDNRSPLVPYLKAGVFALFGDWSSAAIHVSLAFMLGICALLLGLMALKLEGRTTAATVAVLFVVLQFVYVDATDAMCATPSGFS